jgi:hypothetical protein
VRRFPILICVLVVAGVSLLGCSGSSNGTTSNALTIGMAPASVNVPVGLTAQFTATVTGSTNKGVTWQVNGTTGGNSTLGTISTTGLYTAPATVPSPATMTIKATAQADNKTSATATVTVIPAALVTVSPGLVSVPAGGTQSFTANVAGNQTNQVTWQVNGVIGGSSATGTITTLGVYTAPLSPPPGGSVTITAVALNSQNTSGSATATITFSNASLRGSYAFAVSGSNATGLFAVAGSFQADGNGNLTSGVEDVNNSGVIATNVALTGTYSVGPDGRGSAQINTSSGTSNLRFALVSNLHALVVRFDGNATGTGAFDAQDASAFSTAAIQGKYAFNFSGIDGFGNPLTFGGAFSADGGGGITSGAGDANDGGAVSANLALTGSYGVGSNGRGTATITSSLGSFHFSFYIVRSGVLKFVGLDITPLLSGEVLSQPFGPLSVSTLSGNFVFTVGGASGAGPLAAGGFFFADGNGNLQNGIEDFNNNGVATLNQAFTGTYSISSNGRGTATLNTPLGTFHFAVYPAANGVVELLEMDTGVVSSGAANAQLATSLSTAILKGSLALSFDGVNSGGAMDAVVQLTADGAGNWQGTLDLNNHGTLSSGAQASGTNTVASNGRGTATLQTSAGTRHLVIFHTGGPTILFIGTDASEVIVGQLAKQF